MRHSAVRPVALIALCVSACGGGAPLMHTAHALNDGDLTVGAGFSGTVPVTGETFEQDQVAERTVEEGAFSPGIAPWVSGRYGLGNHFDAGLTYTGRSIRLDGRRAFVFGDEQEGAFSLGIAASGLIPKRDDDLGIRVGGFGGELPVLIGWRSTADVYSVWLGARGGAELLNGQRDLEADPEDPTAPLGEDISGWHAHAGGLLGIRVGFRYVFAVFELGGAMHWAKAEIGPLEISLRQFSIAPAGAIIGRF